MTPPLFAPSVREDDVAAWVDSATRNASARAALVSLLPEQHLLYSGRSTNETTRIRGYLLAAFERVGLPDDALPFVLGELQSGHDAYLVAGAAKALRGGQRTDLIWTAGLLQQARRSIRMNDAPVTFDVYKPRWPLASSTTATAEIAATLRWLGVPDQEEPSQDCCSLPVAASRPRAPRGIASLAMEDQDGRAVRFGEFFSGRPSVVVFFYSRCEVVNKCSLTITKMARLQKELAAAGLSGAVRLAAITYDSPYDIAPRLKSYGEHRGVQFDDDTRFFRVPARFEHLRTAFDLGVNYIGTIPNVHRIELYVLDQRGRIAASFTRLRWTETQVIAELQRVLKRAAQPTRLLLHGIVTAMASLVAALLPKCPLCLVGYASAVGVGSLQLMPYRAWLLPLSLSFVLLHGFSAWRRAQRTQRFAPFVLSVVGLLALMGGSVTDSVPALAFGGAILIVVSTIASQLSLAQRPGSGPESSGIAQ